MKQLQFLVLLIFALTVHADEAMNFEEVYSLIRKNLPELSDEEISNRAAVGLIKELGTRVQLLSPAATNEPSPAGTEEVIGRSTVYRDRFAYISVKEVSSDLFPRFNDKIQELIASNDVYGVVMDLRYADGQDYESAAKVADLFIKADEPLLKLSGKEIRSTENLLQIPIAVLVNGETAGAAEAIAAIIQEKGTGLIIGSKTAGRARVFEVFTLKTGQKLQIGTISVSAGDGKTIPAQGLTPDIAVKIDPQNEQILFRDPYSWVNRSLSSPGGTNDLAAASRNRRFSEAELVRRHRDGFDPEAAALDNGGTEDPVIMDPALARALDFLKGISVLQQQRPL